MMVNVIKDFLDEPFPNNHQYMPVVAVYRVQADSPALMKWNDREAHLWTVCYCPWFPHHIYASVSLCMVGNRTFL